MGWEKRKINPEAFEAIQRQLDAFRKKFGREPLPGDPLFFIPGEDEHTPLSDAQMEEMRVALGEIAAEAGLAPDLVYAIRKTGRVVTERNKHLLTKEAAAEWNAAIAEYERFLKVGKII